MSTRHRNADAVLQKTEDFGLVFHNYVLLISLPSLEKEWTSPVQFVLVVSTSNIPSHCLKVLLRKACRNDDSFFVC